MTNKEAIEFIKTDISRLWNTPQNLEHKEALEMAIKALEAESKWIPVSERLPEKDRYTDFYKCLVAVRCTSHNTICDSFTAYFDGKHFYRNGYDRAIISGVTAWMPLPEPYRVESEG